MVINKLTKFLKLSKFTVSQGYPLTTKGETSSFYSDIRCQFLDCEQSSAGILHFSLLLICIISRKGAKATAITFFLNPAKAGQVF